MEINPQKPINTSPVLDSSQKSATWNSMQTGNTPVATPPSIPGTGAVYNNPMMEQKKGGSGKMIAMVSVILGVVIILAAGAYYYMNMNVANDTANTAENAPIAEVKEEAINDDTDEEKVEEEENLIEQTELDSDGIITEMDSEINELENANDSDSNVQGAKDTNFDTMDLEMRQVNGL